ncbi:MAG: hypothetical protein ACJ8G1_09110 [Vitreoscilla sp.]
MTAEVTTEPPAADAPRQLQFRLQVDAAHCDRAAQGLRAMARYQYRALVRRYEGGGLLERIRTGARRFAPALGAVAFAGGVLAACLSFAQEPSRLAWRVLAASLFLEAVALWMFPPRADRIRAAIRRFFERRFGNRAAARMDKTRRDAPFEAVYDLRGDLLVYSRVEQGAWTQRWHRQLGKFRKRGVALQVPGLLAIYANRRLTSPSIIVLTADDGALAAAIRAQGWTIVDVDPASGDALATA